MGGTNFICFRLLSCVIDDGGGAKSLDWTHTLCYYCSIKDVIAHTRTYTTHRHWCNNSRTTSGFVDCNDPNDHSHFVWVPCWCHAQFCAERPANRFMQCILTINHRRAHTNNELRAVCVAGDTHRLCQPQNCSTFSCQLCYVSYLGAHSLCEWKMNDCENSQIVTKYSVYCERRAFAWHIFLYVCFLILNNSIIR